MLSFPMTVEREGGREPTLPSLLTPERVEGGAEGRWKVLETGWALEGGLSRQAHPPGSPGSGQGDSGASSPSPVTVRTSS
jgi:hypothetical protein